MKKVLIIGYVWLEETSGAGSRMLQLIEQFLRYDYKITFASASQKTVNSINLTALGIVEQQIELNSSSFDVFISKLNPDIVLFDRFMIEEQFGWRVAENCPNVIRVLDTEDLHSLRKTRHECLKKGINFSSGELLKSDVAKREVASILRCDLSLIISSFEMEILKNTFKIDQSLLLHLPFLLDLEQNQIKKWLTFENRKDFIFVGNFLHQPNVDSVLQLKILWKSIRKKLPKTKIYVYGAYPTQQIQQLHNEKEGFIIKGFTEDVISKVKKAKVVLAPIRFGAGIKGKLVEAMLCGTPSITTKIGAEGMCENFSWNGIISDLDYFTNNAVVLYSEEKIWEAAQKNGIEIINQLYDKKVLGEKIIRRIEKIKENLTEHRHQNFLGGLLQHQSLNATKYMSKWIELKNS